MDSTRSIDCKKVYVSTITLHSDPTRIRRTKITRIKKPYVLCTTYIRNATRYKVSRYKVLQGATRYKFKFEQIQISNFGSNWQLAAENISLYLAEPAHNLPLAAARSPSLPTPHSPHTDCRLDDMRHEATGAFLREGLWGWDAGTKGIHL